MLAARLSQSQLSNELTFSQVITMNEQKPQAEWRLVPVPATDEMVNAIEAAVDAQLTASGIEPSTMHRQDGDAIYAAAMAAAPGAPAGFALVPLVATEEQLDAAHEAHETPDEGSESEYRAEYRRTYRAMVAAAPAPDGYQRTVQVPGMPGAAMDAALEEAALIAISEYRAAAGPYATGRQWASSKIAQAIRARKSIAAPVSATPVEVGSPPDVSAQFNGFDISKLPPILISCVAKLWPGSNGLFWEQALEKLPERIEQMLAAAPASAAATGVSRLSEADVFRIADEIGLSYRTGKGIKLFAAAIERHLAAVGAAPVQQAAPSDWSGAAEKVRTAVHGIIGEGFYLRLAELDFASIIASSAPAQPASLSDDRVAALTVKCDLLSASLKQADAENARLAALIEQHKLDADRYRLLRDKEFGGEELIEGDTLIFGERMDQMLDAYLEIRTANAVRAAKEAP